MSEYEHYRGKAVKIELAQDQSVDDYALVVLKSRGHKLEDFYKNPTEQLCDDFYGEYFFYNKDKSLYTIYSKELNPHAEVIEAHKEVDGSIRFELRYYNGGAGFDECLSEAFDKMTE
jgi:hypothetical protein